jgi:hypothetical protein
MVGEYSGAPLGGATIPYTKVMQKSERIEERKKMMNLQGKGLVFTLRQYAQSITRTKIPLRGLFLGNFFLFQNPVVIQGSTKISNIF